MIFSSHLAAQDLQRLGAFTPPKSQAAIDAEAAAKEKAKVAILDSTNDAIGSYAANSIRSDAMAALIEWAKTPATDLDEGETMADRLLAMNIGLADDNKDGDITDDEADVIDVALNAQADYLASLGVSDEDISALLEDQSPEASDRVLELLGGELPASDDDALAAADAFVFDSESNESVLDSVMGILDAVYKKKLVIRGGKKMRIMKRVSGRVRLSAAQKVAIRKASRKSHSSGARVRRMKSMKIRARAGL